MTQEPQNQEHTKRMGDTRRKSFSDVLYALSYPESMELFRLIASHPQCTKEDLLTRFESQLSKKWFYAHMTRLITAGLVRRKNNKYTSTAFGRIAYKACQFIQGTRNKYRYQLEALEKVRPEMPAEEWEQMAKSLIKNDDVLNAAFTSDVDGNRDK